MESWKEVYAKAESRELILSECVSSNEPHNKLNHDALRYTNYYSMAQVRRDIVVGATRE
jgi:hypothetical protein